MTAPATRDLLDFTGKTVLVTGSGSGLGCGIATRFAEAGADVIVNYQRSRDGAQAVVQAIEKLGRRALALQADVTDRSSVESLVSRTAAAFGRLDVLVNNAGVYPLASLLDMTDVDWDAVVDSNLRGVFLCTQLAARQMIAQGGGGAIVNIASVEGESPAPLHSHYNAAKGGVLMHTRAAACELAPHGIRVNAVSPGLIWREGLEQAWPDGVERWKKAAPLARLGLPDDVADACLFLASPAARWITGTNLRVDGGVLARPSF
jgi:3-oxoacyl-[acyl-carrier protein] reductase